MPLLRILRGTALVLTVLAANSTAAWSQQSQIVPAGTAAETHKQTVERINGGRVGIISGGIGGTYIRIATDLASVLDDGDGLRVLPVMGKGSVQNIIDILYLRGIDVGIVQSDVLSYLKTQPKFRDIGTRINYITKLYNEEFHLVSSSGIKSVQDLAGKKVNVGLKGSGTFMTATTVFKALGVQIVPVNHDQALALEKIKRGEIAATVYVAGKPARAVTGLKAADGLRLLPIPYTPALRATYLPAAFSAADYPELLKGSRAVETIAVGAVMAVFNWRPGSARHQRVKRFVNAFFSKFPEFQRPPRHKKWQEVNLNATLPGWTRFGAATEWLAANKQAPRTATRQSLQRFVANRATQSGGRTLSPSQQEALFRDFMRWRQASGQ